MFYLMASFFCPRLVPIISFLSLENPSKNAAPGQQPVHVQYNTVFVQATCASRVLAIPGINHILG